MILALVMAFAFGISALAEEGSQSLDEALGSAKSVTVPMKTDYTLGSEKLIDFDGYTAYGFAVKVNLEAKEILAVKFCGKGEEVDTVIKVYKKNGEAFERITNIEGDNDNCNGNGEKMVFTADETREYYIMFLGYDYDETGECIVEIEAIAEILPSIVSFNKDNLIHKNQYTNTKLRRS